MYFLRFTRQLFAADHFIWRRPWSIFSFFFLVLLALYAGTYRAGWVYDTLEWLRMMREMSFSDYINFSHHNQLSHYQLTQILTWLLYQFIGTNRFGWLLIHLAFQAANTTLLFGISKSLFRDAGVRQAHGIALLGAFLFCTSPYISEPVVYKAAFHFLLGLILVLLVLHCLIRYMHSGSVKWAVLSISVFLLSVFSLEFFYFTPLFSICVLLFYRSLEGFPSNRWKRAFVMLILPELLMLGLHRVWVLDFFNTSGLSKNLAALSQPFTFYAIKPALCFFHLFWGRFLPQTVRDAYHHLACNHLFAALLYGGLFICALWIAMRIRKFRPLAKIASLFFFLLLIASGFAALVWFPENGYIYCDRYIYLLLPFFYMLLGIAIYAIPKARIKAIAAATALVLNLTCAIYMCLLWKSSAAVLDRLQASLPANPQGIQMILLNNPWSMKGTPMIGNHEEEDLAGMRRELYTHSPVLPIKQVADYDMQNANDGAQVRVIDDSTLQVRLNQGRNWMKGYNPAKSYTESAFDMELRDGSMYLLHLHNAAGLFTLLYQAGGQLKAVDMNVRDRDQR